ELNTHLYRPALETLHTLIRTSTSSMTSVPKPLKFLGPHYSGLQELFETWPASENKSLFAHILSVLAMTYSDTESRGTLRYRILSASLLPPTSKISEPGSWGHECARHITVELGGEYTIRQEGEEAVPLPVSEADSGAPKSKPAPVPPPEDVTFLRTIHKIYLRFSKFPEALSVAIRLNDAALIRQGVNASENPVMKKQLAFLLARPQIPIEWLKASASEDADADDEYPEDIPKCLSTTQLSRHLKEFGKEVGVADPKSLEDVHKSHLETTSTFHFLYFCLRSLARHSSHPSSTRKHYHS
ncbi:26S proteasome regulatory subunit rpn-1, partial [Suillus subalutaceus]|uniref:26S proteasome regulatory subunit rpn-1 n=1 Tax=Suillus subalutaceus TaxID=48586 RepID=UPI001B876728